MTRTTFLFLISGVMLNAIAQLALKASTRATGPLQVRADTLASTAMCRSPACLWLGTYLLRRQRDGVDRRAVASRCKRRVSDAVAGLHRHRRGCMGIVQ